MRFSDVCRPTSSIGIRGDKWGICLRIFEMVRGCRRKYSKKNSVDLTVFLTDTYISGTDRNWCVKVGTRSDLM